MVADLKSTTWDIFSSRFPGIGETLLVRMSASVPPMAASEVVTGAGHATLLNVLRQRAVNQAKRLAFTFLSDGEADEVNISFGELDRRARAIAAFLQNTGIAGQRAFVLLPSGLEYIAAFFGCMYAGVIVVPGFPVHFGRVRRDETWFRAVVADAGPTLAFATSQMIRRLSKDLAQDSTVSGIQWVDPQSIDDSQADHWQEPQLTSESIAFLQYTSGSTSTPKGVMISHGNILHNQRVIQAACKSDQDSTPVSWLPLYHDMGLIGTVLQPVYIGARSVLMAPVKFLENPGRWLRAITRYRAQSSTAPNFAYELCTQKCGQEHKKDLDLTSWRVAVNGAEPVRYETMKAFVAAFADCGFRAESFFPCYGLAESTLMVTGGRSDALPTVRQVSAQALENNIIRLPNEGESDRLLVGCGSSFLGQHVRIVNPRTLEACKDETVGEIWVKGPSVAQGYWNRPEETSSTFGTLAPDGQGPYLRTGDLGFFSAGQLFITGRLKDLLIIRGRNLYPQDIERTVQDCHSAVTRDCGAAFTIETEGQDSLVVVNEVQQRPEVSAEQLISTIHQAVLLEHAVHVHAIVLVRTGTIPKTTSGKIKRSTCRNLYLAGELKIVGSSIHPLPQTTTTPVAARLSRVDVLQAEPDLRHELIDSSLRDCLAGMLKAATKEISSDQPLVALGIDSLLAVELVNFIESWLGLKLDPSELLKGCSVGDLAALICDHLCPTEELPQEEQDPREGVSHSLSYGQRGLWILHQAAPHSTAYNLACAVRVNSGLDVAAIRHALHGVIGRHAMLRAVFPRADLDPAQLILRNDDIHFDRHFQQVNVPVSAMESLHDLFAAEAQRPFNLESEPSVRLLLFRLPSQHCVLMLVLHHIIADLWSIGILLQDMGLLYSEHLHGKPATLPKVRSDYLDFVRWQTRTIEGPDGDSLLQYWLNQLSGELPVLQLPTDRSRPPMHSYRGSSESMHLNPDLCWALHQLARTGNATLYMVLIAAFQILLHRISGQDDLLLGSPTSGRKSAFSNAIGYFVNPIILRSHYDAVFSFISYLAAVRSVVLKGYEHQDYPFALLVEKLHPQRVAGVPPIFQAMFVWQKTYAGQFEALAPISLGKGGIKLQLGDLSLESIELETGGSQFDLTLMMTEDGSGLLGTFKYNTDLFDAATIKRFAGCFSALLEGIAADPQKEVSTLPLLTATERESLISCWLSRQPVQLPAGPCIHELFEKQAQRRPGEIALTIGEKRLTYADLNAQANQFARHLRRLGVGSEIRVGLCLDRSPEMVIAVLGIWKAGGAYVPFDIRDPQDRLSSLIERSSIEVLITHEQLLERLPSQMPKMVLLDLDLDVITLEDKADLNTYVPPGSLAYMIYTSGSSGEPKGVMIEHSCLINLLAGLTDAIYNQYDRTFVVGLNAPLSFDSSIKQLLTLALGHTLCLIPEGIRRDGAALLAYVHETRIHVLDLTPTQVQLLLQAGFNQSNYDSLMLLIGGEPVSAEMWNALATNGSLVCHNVYGPTECTVDATACRIDPHIPVSIGQPLSGTRVYLLGPDLEPVPTGVPGEICISGPSVGRGYLNYPDLTAARFVPDSFNPVPGSRMYRTGDRARYLPDGNLQFIGRFDRQVKVRGFRVELGEIEAALDGCEGVEDAAVVVWNGENGGKHLIGYVVTTEPKPSNHYRQLLAQRIPEYMIPAVVVTVPKIPTSANGKRDYAALPVPEVTAVEPGNQYVPPRTAVEDYLARLWTDTLRVQPVGVHDNFFALGGDSLQATRMIARIHDSYPTDRSLLPLFLQQPTIAELARLIAATDDPMT